MSKILNFANKNLSTYKKHIVPSLATAAIAVGIAVPVTAALGSSSQLAADAPSTPASVTETSACVAPVSGAANSVQTSSYVRHSAFVNTPPSNTVTASNGNGGGQGNGNGSGNGNTTSGGSAAANGNAQTNNGLVGVNAIVPVSAANNDLNDVASGDTVNVPVNVPVLNGVLSTITGGLSL